MALSSSGSVQATQLFAPYGSSRYSSGSMPTSHGFTGQRGDPSGNCFIICDVLACAAIGAAIAHVPQVVSNVQNNGLSASAFTNVNWKPVIAGAAGGAVAGLGVGLLGGASITNPIASSAIGAASGAAYQATDNALNNRLIGQGVGTATAWGAATGLAFWGAGKILGSAGRAIAGCPNSFDPATVVATPHGEQAIGSLKAGDVVQAYDPVTG